MENHRIFVVFRKEFFERFVDDLAKHADEDSEIKEGLKFLNDEAFKLNITIYDMVAKLLSMPSPEERAEKWNKDRLG